MKRVLVIDNYDSFVFNLARVFSEQGAVPEVVRNDEIRADEITRENFDALVISPGPCGPNEAGVSCAAIQKAEGHMPILGVCLGHQCIGQVYGLDVEPSGLPVHGQETAIFHDSSGLFKGLPSPFPAARYHALTVRHPGDAHPLEMVAETDSGQVMGLTHRALPIFGVQFHPESILTPHGGLMISSFLNYISPKE